MNKDGDIFEGLFIELKKRGFTLSVTDYIEFSAIYSQFKQPIYELKYYLAPIVCKNKKEQAAFYQVFDEYCFELVRKKKNEAMDRKLFFLRETAAFLSSVVPILVKVLLGLLLFVILLYFAVLNFNRLGQQANNTATDSSAVTEAPVISDTASPIKNTPVQKAVKQTTNEAKPLPLYAIHPNGKRYLKQNNVHPTAITWLILFGSVFTCLSFSFFPIKKDKLLPEIDSSTIEGDDLPIELPFEKNDILIQKIPDITFVAEKLLLPHDTGISVLNIEKTLLQSIENYGCFSPIYNPVKRKLEFLVLIEENNMLHSRLFKYLAKMLLEDTVDISYYFFSKAGIFSPADTTTAVSFYHLRERHSDARLIVMGDGYDFINPYKGNIRTDIRNEFVCWQEKLLITYKPVMDWGRKEAQLRFEFDIIAADLESIPEALDTIFEGSNQAGLIIQPPTYSSRYLSPENITRLSDYLGDEHLFQWVCALAIYPSVKWEMVLAIGNAVLSNYGAEHKLNYANILKIVRIAWINNGSIPDETRLQLLQKLNVDSEIAARKAILSLLLQAQPVVEKQAEWELQVNTQRFVIYANDRKRNSDFDFSARKFLSMWNKGLVLDKSTSIYLQNKENAWQTPVKSVNNNARNVGVDRFANELLALKIINNPVLRRTFRWAGAACFIVLAGLFLFTNPLAHTSANQAIGFIKSDYANNDITVVIPVNSCISNAGKMDSMTVLLKNFDNNTYIDTCKIPRDGSPVKARFKEVTMAGRADGENAFYLLLNNKDTVYCSYKNYYTQYTVTPINQDCR